MFYCSEYEKATTPELEKQISDMRLAHSRLRIVTTRNYGEFAGVTQNQIKPRSYLFSAAAVGGLPVNDLHPTVTFSFDPSAVGSDGGALFVYTYHEADGVWRLKPTYQQPFVTRASHPLEPGTGNAALDPLDHPAYYYRLFLVPGDGQPPEQVGPAPDPMP
jgi:hypothetical protein